MQHPIGISSPNSKPMVILQPNKYLQASKRQAMEKLKPHIYGLTQPGCILCNKTKESLYDHL